MIDRASAVDLMQAATDVGAVPNHAGGVLLFGSTGPSLEAVRRRMESAARALPRLRQRLVRTPLGAGRPVWVDDPDFDVAAHVTAVPWPADGRDRALLDLVARLVTSRLPGHRPQWTATLVVGDDRAALVVVFHHVLADGIGGLAVLAHLVDGAPTGPSAAFPRPAPPAGQLYRDAWRGRVDAVRRLPAGVRRLAEARGELGALRDIRGPGTSLRQPSGPRRRLDLAHADLAAVRRAAHAHDATVNDVVLTATTGALATLLAHRGEHVDRLVASVPVSARAHTDGAALGNRIGVLPVALPTVGAPSERLPQVAAVLRTRKGARRGASALLLAPVFRGLAAVGGLRMLMDHQRLVDTFVTNVPGPDAQVPVGGHRAAALFAVSLATGNVPVAFSVLSYAGALSVTVVSDADLVPDHAVLTTAVQAQLDALAALA